jgi:putative tricarboxylic transport membrane protein
LRTNDAVSGLVLIALASIMIFLTHTFPPFPGQNYGPSLFPRLLGTGIIICGLLLIVQGLGARRAGEPWIVWSTWTREPWRLVSFVLTIGVIVFYILASETVGFLPVACATLLALFLWFRVSPARAVLVAVAGTLVINYFFVHLMRVPLPRGFLNFLTLPDWLMRLV